MKKFFLIFITTFLLFLAFNLKPEETLAACPAGAPTPPPALKGYVCCKESICAGSSKKYWTYCYADVSPDKICDYTPRTCADYPSCGVWNCAEPPAPYTRQTWCKYGGKGACPDPNAHCGPDYPAGCGVVKCNCKTGNCYSDCSLCCPFMDAYAEPTNPRSNSSISFIFTSNVELTGPRLNPGGGARNCSLVKAQCSGNPKDSYRCWWRWDCTAGGSEGSFQATFNNEQNCPKSVSYTIVNQGPSCGGVYGPSEVLPLSRTTYKVDARDSDGDTLTYSWNVRDASGVSCGTIVEEKVTKEGGEILWEAPDANPITCIISVSVNDGRGHLVNCGSLSVTVRQVILVPGWFQTEEGDVHANGGIQDNIPSAYTDPYLSLGLTGETPGVVSLAGSLDLGGGFVSEKGWQANDISEDLSSGFGANRTIYNYSFFEKKLSVGPGTPNFDPANPGGGGVYWNHSSVTFLNPWVVNRGETFVILVDGSLEINATIEVRDGGFLAFIVSGDISIDHLVGKLEGIYIADRQIQTGSGPQKLTGDGMFVAYGGFDLKRDLGTANKNSPAEFFGYRPEFLVNFPQALGLSHVLVWKEIAP